MKKTKNKEQVKTDNPYKSARLRAARENPELGTAERAAELLMIRREKYLQIEQDDPERKTATPSADEVRRMIQLYWAPELRSHYCVRPVRWVKNARQLVQTALTGSLSG